MSIARLCWPVVGQVPSVFNFPETIHLPHVEEVRGLLQRTIYVLVRIFPEWPFSST